MIVQTQPEITVEESEMLAVLEGGPEAMKQFIREYLDTGRRVSHRQIFLAFAETHRANDKTRTGDQRRFTLSVTEEKIHICTEHSSDFTKIDEARARARIPVESDAPVPLQDDIHQI